MNIKLTEIDYKFALQILQYGKNPPDLFMSDLLKECEELILNTAEPKYLYKIFDIDRTSGSIMLSGSTLELTGNDISKHMAGMHKAVMLCATLSAGVDSLIRRMEASDMSKAVVIDALASSAIEDVCDKAEMAARLLFPDATFTSRFSPGYGDFPIGIQAQFLSVLDAPKRIGLTAGTGSMLIPSKSVTAVIGVSP